MKNKPKDLGLVVSQLPLSELITFFEVLTEELKIRSRQNLTVNLKAKKVPEISEQIQIAGSYIFEAQKSIERANDIQQSQTSVSWNGVKEVTNRMGAHRVQLKK